MTDTATVTSYFASIFQYFAEMSELANAPAYTPQERRESEAARDWFDRNADDLEWAEKSGDMEAVMAFKADLERAMDAVAEKQDAATGRSEVFA